MQCEHLNRTITCTIYTIGDKISKSNKNLNFSSYLLFRSDSTRINESTVEFVDANTYYEASSSQ